MELLYVWVDEYLVIKNCGFNFSNKFTITSQVNIEAKEIKLNVEENINYISDFFPGSIISISAIVGENGIGKSTLLDLILSINHNPSNLHAKWLAVYFNEKDKNLFIRGSVLNREGWRYNFNNLKIKYEIEGFKNRFTRNSNDDPFEFQIVSIFYNPSLDLKNYRKSNHERHFGVEDVSTNHLIFTDSEYNQERAFDQVELHRFKNTTRQLALAQSQLIDIGRIRAPKSIEVRFNKTTTIEKSNLGTFAEDAYEKLDQDGRNDFDRVFQLLKNAETSNNWEEVQNAKLEKVKLWFVRNLIDNFFKNLTYEKDLHDQYVNINNAELNEETFFLNARKFFSKQTLIPTSQFDIWNFVKEIFNIIDKFSIKDNGIEDNDSFFDLPVDKAHLVMDLHKRYVKEFGKSTLSDYLFEYDKGFLDFNWRDLSNGEKAYFDLFSRLYDGYIKIQNQLSKNSTLHILIDEGEIGFHPQWQKEYLDRLIYFCNKLTTQKVQLIITSHSPFILSDLPKSNIVLLKKDNNDNVRVTELSQKTQTFGANIHELFADSFFMDGTMGDFAKGKIEKIISALDNSNTNLRPPSQSEKDNLKRLIQLIGEPIIRERLMDLFEERFPAYQESLKEKIKRLRKELKEAEEQSDREFLDGL